MYPDSLSCLQFKSCTVTDFWLRPNLYRDTAPVPLTNILYRDSFPAPIKLVPRHAPCFNKTCTRTAKTTPYPPCTVTAFWPQLAGTRDRAGAASGNTTSLILPGRYQS